MARNRSQTIATLTFPEDWTLPERRRWSEVWKQVRAAKDDYKKVVLATGVFDLLHQEHLNFLRKARAAGNFLVVGVEADQRVRENKGPGRPWDDQQTRVENLLATGYVDVAAVLPENFNLPQHHQALMKLVRPHILAVSSHTPYQTAKKQIVELFGGTLVVVHQHNPEISTTQIIEQKLKEQDA